MTLFSPLNRILAIGACALIVTLGSTGMAPAQMGPDYWRVQGVAADDMLNIRAGAGTQHPVVAVAPNGAVFRNLGCRGEGSSRWCHLETPNGQISGWAAGRFLAESGAPGGGGSAPANDVPELYVRQSGEVEIRFASGCTALFSPSGRQITAGSSCSRNQLAAAQDAMQRHQNESGMGGDHATGGGQAPASADVNVTGSGQIYGGGMTEGRIFGHREGAYTVTISAPHDGLMCTGLYAHAPGTVRSQMTTLHCTNGASGPASLVLNRNGRGSTLTFSLSDHSGGYVLF